MYRITSHLSKLRLHLDDKLRHKKLYKIRWSCLGVASVTILAMSCVGLTSSTPALAEGCDDVQFIFARGSGETLGDTSYNAWHDSIDVMIQDLGLQYSFYELGSQAQSGYQYPAVTVSDGFWGVINLLTAFLTAGEAYEFGKSVEQGINELQAYIEHTSASCPQTKFVLGGYSQGAMVIMRTLDQLDASKIIYAATFGDPKIYLPEGNDEGINFFLPVAACEGRDLSPYRAHVPDCRAYRGILGSIVPYHSAAYAGKVGTWCHNYDIMCSSGSSVEDHTSYVGEHLYGDAATYIKGKLRDAFPKRTHSSTLPLSGTTSLHQLVILIDTNGHMFYSLGLYINTSLRLVRRILDAGGEVAVYSFNSITEKPTELLCNFGCSYDEILESVQPLESGGGNSGNSLLSSMRKAMTELNWQPGSTKTILALTNPWYSYPDLDGTTTETVRKIARGLGGVNFYTLSMKGFDKNYADLTASMGGISFNSTDHTSVYKDKLVETISQLPAAKVNTSAYRHATGTTYTFDARTSTKRTSSATYQLARNLDNQGLAYDWDLDGDDIFELEDADAVVEHVYDSDYTGYAQVRVRDGDYSATATIPIDSSASHAVELIPTPAASADVVSQFQVTSLDDHTVRVSFDTDAPKVLLAINDAILGFIEPQSQHTEFILHDVVGDTNIALIPYSNNGFRGTPNNVVAHGAPATNPDSSQTSGNGNQSGNQDDINTDVNTPDTPTSSPSSNTQGSGASSGNQSDPNDASATRPSGDKTPSGSSYPHLQTVLDQIHQATHVIPTPDRQHFQVVPKAPDTGSYQPRRLR